VALCSQSCPIHNLRPEIVPECEAEQHRNGKGVHLTSPRENAEGIKQHGSGPEWFDKALDERRKEATKAGGDWFGPYAQQKANGTISPGRLHGSRSDSRKAASALIAEIPFTLAEWIARCFTPSA
jgi:hypothetical protein